ncbi:beta subunit of fatty acid synthetase [Ophidiomyces ophidiicola]|uniref:Beta subunit of fatty acid synthetase n=1 Tax=Ophidiomyces ophidiicola TaxID=1387563 RepID=A0ACB8UV05_9EURO|nr:beta subunit of fatty acid synthetase [Ophidiomyces ophidiicola]KAI1945742.1 beta subunit of fatty acid synthetase [Ophidiomyces ophidiicola]KAI1950660.1 beta subunit of fatty acid synthetase [Ophidiomyces ophidiicola]KAI1972623.1 beta subunit of fatty acid synthetase [Ophidiomyces ophidiicola]KAI2006626.1 beta subunit of fatty acid synthetase [Ophidiomyces ophidiicola]KAI2018337.1 beta subunit of fatty acid synthetase [Ophidiomyces ophidiicola]
MYGTSTGPQTGINTPRSSQSLRPLFLSHGSLDFSFLVPTSLHFHASQLKDAFSGSLPAPTDELAQDDEPSSVPELVARYLNFVARHVEEGEDDSQGSYLELLKLVLNEFERAFMRGNDVHAIAGSLPGIAAKKLLVVEAYYAARASADRPTKPHESALLRAAAEGDAKIYSVYGGQGNIEEYFDELREVYSTYPSFVEDLISSSAELLQSLARDPDAIKQYSKGMDILRWLHDRDSQPDIDYLVSAPVSFPLIGLVQLAHYMATCKAMGKQPGEILERFSGTTGHSQGIVTAAVITTATSWESFGKAAKNALTILFWIGLRSQQAYPRTSLAPSTLQDSIENGEGIPTPMLSIRDLPRAAVQEHIDATNQHLPKDRHIGISLVNSARNFVVTGPPISLYGLNLRLRKVKAPTGLDQNRVPFTERKIRFVNRFLPITVPFHSKYLTSAFDIITEDLEDIQIPAKSLRIPVYNTNTGKDLRLNGDEDIVPALVRMITSDPVNWENATVFDNATHILDFGPGGISGLGVLTNRNKDGTGVRVIIAGSMDGTNAEVGYKSELFDRDEEHAIKYAVDWVKEFGPRLVKTSVGQTFVDTKMSRLLGVPPVMVAGMTPSTVPWDFVAATMNAGYQIELAGGGYYNAKSMTEALHKIEKSIPPGRGITVNLIYVNPRAMGWQIPLIAKLRADGVPIEGLTIGAGVPSIEVANEYIETLGIKHIGFKPGSMEAIQQVINIAKANPTFPVFLQWTGGRGGGHHSFEDFHQPILQMYSRIRRCGNIVFVAGSGFGGAEDTYPYLTGTWSRQFGYPPMPFDGCMFGSRMMTAKEAHTSKAAKEAIAAAPGVDDSQWEKTYSGEAGGVITVRSEMGEPIHKLATRGVLFWAEMDKKIFSLDKAKRIPELKKQRDYIIKKLNDDFQKVWFGRNSSGQTVDLEDMTYAEVVHRMVELMYVKHQSRWIDDSLKRLTGDFIRRVEERFTSVEGQASLLQCYSQIDKPYPAVDDILKAYPEAFSQLISAQDVQHFLILCQRRGQKPVPFVPSLDENFEFWFKKDSLWQSEDLEAVVGQDVGRVCILQGPMAVKYSNTVDEPIQDILDGIHTNHIKGLVRDVYGGQASNVPVVEYFGGHLPLEDEDDRDIDGLTISEEANKVSYRLSSSPSANLPDLERWLHLLAGRGYSWRHAFFTTEVFIQGHRFQSNPMKRLLAPTRGMYIEVANPNEPQKTIISVREPSQSGKLVKTVEIRMVGPKKLALTLFEGRTAEGGVIPLPFQFTYHPETGYAPIREVMEGRNDRIKEFYYRLWFGEKSVPFDAPATSIFDGGVTTVVSKDIADFVHAVGNTGEAFVDRPGKEVFAPMDFAIVVGWKAITKPIFPRVIDGDLLRLVHQSNGFRMVPGAEPLKVGDVLETTAQINAIINQDSGKMVEVCGTIKRDGQPVMHVTSQFLYRGTYTDYETTFQRKEEMPMQVHLASTKDAAVLQSKEWFRLDDPDVELLGQTLTFRLQSVVRFEKKNIFRSVQTMGQVLLELPSKEVIQIASVEYEAGTSHGNPVIDYLQRHGQVIEQPVHFENPIPLSGKTPLILKAPASNETYARVSGDYNPIHVSRVFSSYANLPGTITHGMYTSAAVRSLVETWAAENNIGRVRSFHASLVGMVLPNDELVVKLQHVGMVAGRKIIKVETSNQSTEEKVLLGEAEVEQPVSAYVFTGQGSQEQGMGMDLYNSSAVAKEVWDRADKHFLENYGFSIINIVKNNPRELTIHFGGPRGKKIRQNYMSMTFESVNSDGTIKSERIFKEVSEQSTSYTYRSPSGLLSATQFTQPALTLMEKASFEDMRSKGLVQRDSSFAGHSLGEYSALAALADVMPIESLVSVVFYRGLTMQVAVERDEQGRSNYSMCAVNPSRISRTFNEQALQYVVENISEECDWLLEIVNYNVANMQYVCAGDLRALDCLTNVLNVLKAQKIDIQALMKTMSLEDVKAHLVEIIKVCKKQTEAKPTPLTLERGFATIPLKGIDVPFHSTFLRSGVKPFRSFLLKKINKSTIDPSKLIGKYIPNVTAQPFQITKEYFEEVYRLTNSPRIGHVLANWEKYEDPLDAKN